MCSDVRRKISVMNIPAAMLMVAGAMLLVFTAAQAQAQTFTVIHTFTGGGDGADPRVGVTPDGRGNLYGTASAGGPRHAGVVFKLSHSGTGWVLNPLYSFTGDGRNDDGRYPNSRVIIGPDGALYGMTTSGGPMDGGTVFKLTPPTTVCRSTLCSWTETVLHTFPDPAGTDGLNPVGDLVFDAAGNVYGITPSGGSGNPNGCYNGCGVVFQMHRSQGAWTENIVHEFTAGSDGGAPQQGVALDASGNLYGAACTGGFYGHGVDFEISVSDWVETPLYTFQGGSNGNCPFGVIRDSSGNLYGSSGGGSNGRGQVYEISRGNGGWNLSSLYSFLVGGGANNLTLDGHGNLYGTTFQGGNYNVGTVFKLTYSSGTWTYTLLHEFTGGADGSYPQDQVVVDSNGNVFGTASNGGDYQCSYDGCGTVWEITP